MTDHSDPEFGFDKTAALSELGFGDADPVDIIAAVIWGDDFDYEQRDRARSVVSAIRSNSALRRALWLALTSDNPLRRLSKAPSSPVSASEPVSGTSSYTGVIRDADGAEAVCVWCDGVGRSGRFVCECCQPDAFTPNSTVAALTAERDEARAEVVRLRSEQSPHVAAKYWAELVRRGNDLDAKDAEIERLTEQIKSVLNQRDELREALTELNPALVDAAECCASGRCEVCRPGWGRS